jgi:hypothetical protein
MRLIPLTLAQWQHERRWEAAERAAAVRFVADGRVALFVDPVDGYVLYTREAPGDTHPDSGTQSTTMRKELPNDRPR